MTIFKHKRVAIDFDGTLVEDLGNVNESYEKDIFLPAKKDASKITNWLKEMNFEILVFTCRPDYHRKYIEKILDAHNITFDYILFYTKPRVDLYIDDKGFRFNDWITTKEFIEKHL